MKIKICSICDGKGEITEDIGTHNSKYVYSTCWKCNGTGRIKTRKFSYSVPYDMGNTEIYKVDSEIFDLIRKLESKQKL